MRYRKMLSSFLMLLVLAIVMGACGQGSAQAGSSAPVALGTSNAVQPSRQVTTPEPTPDLGTGSHARPLKISACLDEIAQNFGTWYVSIAGTKKVIEWNFNMEVAHLIHPGIYVQLFGVIYLVQTFQQEGQHHALFALAPVPHRSDECVQDK